MAGKTSDGKRRLKTFSVKLWHVVFSTGLCNSLISLLVINISLLMRKNAIFLFNSDQ